MFIFGCLFIYYSQFPPASSFSVLPLLNSPRVNVDRYLTSIVSNTDACAVILPTMVKSKGSPVIAPRP